MVGNFLPLSLPALSQAVSRRSSLIIKALQKVKNPDWVIGHNPGALWPALKAAKRFNCNVGFDVEDYHPGEGNNQKLQALTSKLMLSLLPGCNYVSFAAPLIMQKLEQEITGNTSNWFTVMNYFPVLEFQEPSLNHSEKITLVWFSQNISAGRGLELVLPFIKQHNSIMELHLIGNPDQAFFEGHLKGNANIVLHAPVSQQELHQLLGKFDIGLALDIPVDVNRDLVITNKILAYLQAGLYVVASNTAAQGSFLNDYPEHGVCFNYQTNDSGNVLQDVIQQIAVIRDGKVARYKSFKNNNWEMTSLKLLSHWDN
ncbi:MAG: hypothetical protein ABIQ31_19530 [Ferruginibacter sp.]